MKFETKFDVGDTVLWLTFREERCAECTQYRSDKGRWLVQIGTIVGIAVTVDDDMRIAYMVDGRAVRQHERDLYGNAEAEAANAEEARLNGEVRNDA